VEFLMDIAPDADAPAPKPPALQLRELSKDFGKLRVLDPLSLDFESGRVTALLGPNGAGKTTMLKCILGLVRPTSGHVVVDGERSTDDGAYRHKIGFMPQLPQFPAHMTGWEVVEMVHDLRGFRGEPDEDLIDDFAVRPHMTKPFRELSGGTRQKVNAALAFRYRTPILVLDEPTAGLDPVSSLALKEKVRGSRDDGRTVVITSHNLGEVESLADDVVFLLEGQVRFQGAIERLLGLTEQATLEEAIASLMQSGGVAPTDDGSATLVVLPADTEVA
jgi:Cu-processing system ATP-binding protein